MRRGVKPLWVPAVTHYFLLSLIVVLPAIFLERALNHRLRREAFLEMVHGGLVSVRMVLLIHALRHR